MPKHGEESGVAALARLVLSLCACLAGAGTALAAPAQEPAQEPHTSSPPAPVTSPDWAQFRGPRGSGVATGPERYPERLELERDLVWRCALPEGLSSPCLVGDRIFLTGHEEEQLVTLCIERASGELAWRRELRAERLERGHRINSPASSTCAADEQRVYAYFGAFGVLAYDHAGTEVWRRAMPLAENTFGSAASPVLAQDRLLLVRDTNEDSALLALDAASGETLWERARDGFRSGWSTPTRWSQGGREQLLVYGVWWLTDYDLESGEELWSVPGLTDEPIVTPVTGEGLVFVTSYNMKTNTEVMGLPSFDELLRAYDADADGRLSRAEAARNESVLSRNDADGEGDHPLRIFFGFLDANGDGQLCAEEWPALVKWLDAMGHDNALLAIRPGSEKAPPQVVWRFPRGVPECPSPLYHDGRITMVKNGGLITCLRAASGAPLFEGRLGAGGPYYASPVCADGKIYSTSARGVLTITREGERLEVLGQCDLGERVMATPALAQGRLFVRTESSLLMLAAHGD